MTYFSKHLFTLLLTFMFALSFGRNEATAQNYLGFGLHFPSPISIDNCCNSYVNVTPLLTPAVSLTFKKKWKTEKGREWYNEVGITSSGLGYYWVTYLDNTSPIWVDNRTRHIGFPSLLIGGGRIWPLRGKSM